MDIRKVITLDTKPATYSVSRLNVYKQCSEKYNLTYIQKLRVFSASNSTIAGNLLHDALEVYLRSDNTTAFIPVFEEQSKVSLVKRKFVVEHINLTSFNKLYAELIEYSRDIKSLHERASADYTGKNAIRTAKGDVPSNPSMTSGWKAAVKNLNLDGRYRHLEDEFSQISCLDSVNLVEAFTDAYTLASNYVTPEEIVETVALEFPLSDFNYETKEFVNPVLMPDEYGGIDYELISLASLLIEGVELSFNLILYIIKLVATYKTKAIYLNGFIDWMGYVQFKGKRRFALIDYKSSKENLTVDKLEYHAQLLAYVYAVERLLGIKVEVIGVHSLRHKKLALALVDREILEVANRSLFSKHKQIAACHFEKEHLPDSQYSKCLDSYGKNCEYLQHCYPKMYNYLNPNSLSNQLESLLAS